MTGAPVRGFSTGGTGGMPPDLPKYLALLVLGYVTVQLHLTPIVVGGAIFYGIYRLLSAISGPDAPASRQHQPGSILDALRGRGLGMGAVPQTLISFVFKNFLTEAWRLKERQAAVCTRAAELVDRNERARRVLGKIKRVEGVGGSSLHTSGSAGRVSRGTIELVIFGTRTNARVSVAYEGEEDRITACMLQSEQGEVVDVLEDAADEDGESGGNEEGTGPKVVDANFRVRDIKKQRRPQH
jgi:hypothetical protein